MTSSWSVSAEKGEVEPCIFRIRLEQHSCHANGGTSKRSAVNIGYGLKACMHLDIKVRAGVVGGSSRTRPLADWQPCMDPAAHIHTHTPRLGTRNHSCGLGTRAHVSETTRIMPQPPALCRRTPAHCTMLLLPELATPCPGWEKGLCSGLSRCRRARPLGLTGAMVSFCFVPQPRL